MGLLDRLKSNKNNKDFFEDTDNKWFIELVGTFSFNKDNDDWA